MKNQYRIGQKTLLKLDYSSSRKNFLLFDNQFVLQGTNSNITYNNSSNYLEIIEKTVWSNTGKINKIFNSPILIDENLSNSLRNEKIISGTLLLKQGFDFENIFGILVVIKTMGNQLNEKILISQLFNLDNFKFNFDDSKELISGSFWTKSINFCIPNIGESLMISIENIYFNDVISSGIDFGKINNYPTNVNNFEPLVSEEPIPNFLQTNVSLTDYQYLNIEPITLETNKTFEKSLLDYFNISEEFIIPVTIEHIVKYGTDVFGYKTIRIINEDFKYGPISIGLDLTGFNSQTIEVFVSTEINCNNKLIKREQSIIFSFQNILSPVISNLVLNPTSIFPVEVKNINNITNTVIHTEIQDKIIPIFQPIFVEIINEDVIFDNKNISFNDIKIQSYFITLTPENENKDFVLSKSTIDGKIYYDLSLISKPETNTKFKIISAENNNLLKTGILKIT